jgi:uncharacterized protein YggE
MYHSTIVDKLCSSLVTKNMVRRFITMKGRWLFVALLAISAVAIAVPGCADDRRPGVPLLPLPRGPGDNLGTGSPPIWSQQSVGLWVTGDGKVTAAPDTVVLTLGVDSQEKTVAEAQRKAADAMDKVMKALKTKGVADKDIQTQQFNISPVIQWIDKENRQQIIGYHVTNTVVAKIRQVDKAGGIIDDVANAAGDLTRINAIDFTVDDPTPYYKDARAKAVANTVANAKQMADAAGVRLGRLLYMTENVAYTPQPIRNFAKADSAMAAPAPTPISPGELTFQVTIQMVYDMR